MEENLPQGVKNGKSKSKIIIGIIALLIIVVGIYFLIPYLKLNKPKTPEDIMNENIKIGEMLENKIIPMTEEEKISIGKRLEEESKNLPEQTPEQKQKILEFLNS